MNKAWTIEREALSVGRVLLGSLVVVVSVVLGFLVSQWDVHARDRALAAGVRRSIALEVADNLRTIEPQAARHYAALTALHRLRPDPDQTASRVLFENLHGDLGAPLKRAAWDAAMSSGGLRLLDHGLVERYAEIYDDQERLYDDDFVWLRPALYRPENYDPRQQAVALAALSGALTELAGDEVHLRDLYRQDLPVLQKAAQ